MGQATFSDRREALEKARSYMEVALELLDQSDAPADIGAHLDLALNRLQAVVESRERDSNSSSGRPAGNGG